MPSPPASLKVSASVHTPTRPFVSYTTIIAITHRYGYYFVHLDTTVTLRYALGLLLQGSDLKRITSSFLPHRTTLQLSNRYTNTATPTSKRRRTENGNSTKSEPGDTDSAPQVAPGAYVPPLARLTMCDSLRSFTAECLSPLVGVSVPKLPTVNPKKSTQRAGGRHALGAVRDDTDEKERSSRSVASAAAAAEPDDAHQSRGASEGESEEDRDSQRRSLAQEGAEPAPSETSAPAAPAGTTLSGEAAVGASDSENEDGGAADDSYDDPM